MAVQSMGKISARKKRHLRTRKRVSGSQDRPRLSVFRSAKHIYAQVIDDEANRTLAAASSGLKGLVEAGGDSEVSPRMAASRAVGIEVAKRCREQGITTVAFDRGGYLYHGRVRAVAEGAREGGLEF